MATEGRPKSKSLLHSRGIQVLIVVVVIAVAAIIYYSGRSGQPTYFTSQAKTGNITSVVQATGVINPPHSITIGAQVSGIITKINYPDADFDGHVKKGEWLAQIDPTVYEATLASDKADLENSQANVQAADAQVGVAEANVASATANLAKANADLTLATATKDRSLSMYGANIESTQQRDTDVDTFNDDKAQVQSVAAALVQAKAQLKSAQASVAQATAVVAEKTEEVKTAQTNLNYCTIYAPSDGVIIQRAVDIGQTVASSLQTPTLFSESSDLTKLWVYMQTDESDEGRLQAGDDATFTVDAYPSTVYHGTALMRRMFATTVQNVVEYDTIIAFDNVNEKLFPGMTAYVNVPVASARNTLEVPNSALRFKPNFTPVQLRQVLAQNGIQDTGSGAPAAGASAAGGGRRGSGAGGGRRPGAGSGRGGQGAAGAATDANRPTTALIWKLDENKQLVPVRVRTGITDFTYTAITRVLQGSLKSGDEIVTGELVKNPTGGLPGAGGRPGR